MMPACPAAIADLNSGATRFLRVLCNYLGMLLDRGRDSAHAIHPAAIRADKGPTFSLNASRPMTMALAGVPFRPTSG
jgi:hypothetical protein